MAVSLKASPASRPNESGAKRRATSRIIDVLRSALEVTVLVLKRLGATIGIGNTRGSSVRITDPSGAILFVKTRYQRSWSLPGGYVNRDESYLDAAVREVREEVGLELERSDLVRVGDLAGPGRGHVTAVYRVLLPARPRLGPPPSWEIARIGWFTEPPQPCGATTRLALGVASRTPDDTAPE